MEDLLGIKNINSHSEQSEESLTTTFCKGSFGNFPQDDRGKCVVTPPEFLSSQSSLRNSALPVQGGRKFTKAGFTLAEGATHVGLPPIIAKAGFTLAEVLITLGIIGVVAAMTIPNLITNTKNKRLTTQLKATQSILSNAIRLAEEEYGDMSGWNVKMEYSEQDAKNIANVLKQFLKLTLDCGTMDADGYCSPKVRYLLLSGVPHSGNYYDNNKYYKVVLLNGSHVWWRSGNQDEYKNNDRVAVFWIDLNGDKLPNQVGRDLFLFDYERGAFRPQGAPGYHEDGTCKLNAAGWGCSYFVLTHGHMKYPKN